MCRLSKCEPISRLNKLGNDGFYEFWDHFLRTFPHKFVLSAKHSRWVLHQQRTSQNGNNFIHHWRVLFCVPHFPMEHCFCRFGPRVVYHCRLLPDPSLHFSHKPNLGYLFAQRYCAISAEYRGFTGFGISFGHANLKPSLLRVFEWPWRPERHHTNRYVCWFAQIFESCFGSRTQRAYFIDSPNYL